MDKLFLPLVNSQIAIIPTYKNYLIKIYFNTKNQNYYIGIIDYHSLKSKLFEFADKIELYFQNTSTKVNDGTALFAFCESRSLFNLQFKPYIAVVFYHNTECTEYGINDELLHMWITKIKNYYM